MDIYIYIYIMKLWILDCELFYFSSKKLNFYFSKRPLEFLIKTRFFMPKTVQEHCSFPNNGPHKFNLNGCNYQVLF